MSNPIIQGSAPRSMKSASEPPRVVPMTHIRVLRESSAGYDFKVFDCTMQLNSNDARVIISSRNCGLSTV